MEKEASIQTAVQAMKNNRPLRAEEVCRDYLLMSPGCTDHLRLLGHSLMKQDRLKEAEEQLQLAITLNPDFPQLYEDLGSVLAMERRFDEAIPLFEKAIRLEPRLPLAHTRSLARHSLPSDGVQTQMRISRNSSTRIPKQASSRLEQIT